ncbi:hypothetical protein DFA_07818 [Cavenderia fasciculata]|uniref:Uncharacterized protein n=1 Tax=Cavenderia fasciculata TaxID=261658 RepID=F4Q3H1_CACFS|nr:uncharacterized protein DFA_07818 [Cavenderia fasciculata]EGG16840.1 hypothetical protein DFA_07818 [Cavenderia fasciculata]|eukprot:XP_004355314.1 hypothetical protein DFA_07818 [Cavenderia fasciculata]
MSNSLTPVFFAKPFLNDRLVVEWSRLFKCRCCGLRATRGRRDGGGDGDGDGDGDGGRGGGGGRDGGGANKVWSHH